MEAIEPLELGHLIVSQGSLVQRSNANAEITYCHDVVYSIYYSLDTVYTLISGRPMIHSAFKVKTPALEKHNKSRGGAVGGYSLLVNISQDLLH